MEHIDDSDTTAAMKPTGWKTLPFELRSKIASHYIDILLDDLRPTYFDPLIGVSRRVPSRVHKIEWLDSHPLFPELDLINVIWGDMTGEINYLCDRKRSCNFPGFTDWTECWTELNIRIAATAINIQSSTFLIQLNSGFLQGNLPADGIVALRQADQFIARQKEFEQWLLLRYHRARTVQWLARTGSGGSATTLRLGLKSRPPTLGLPTSIASGILGRLPFGQSNFLHFRACDAFDYERFADENSRAVENFKGIVWRLLERAGFSRTSIHYEPLPANRYFILETD